MHLITLLKVFYVPAKHVFSKNSLQNPKVKLAIIYGNQLNET